MVLPNSRGPNLHVIGAMSTFGMELCVSRRGSFRHETANRFIHAPLLDAMLQRGVDLTTVVLVVDNAPCHSRNEQALTSYTRGPPTSLLRLSPYSPMLNPIENVWSKLKAVVKRENRVPVVQGRGVGKQRMVYLEKIVNTAIATITLSDCANSIQHASSLYPLVINLQDMPSGG